MALKTDGVKVRLVGSPAVVNAAIDLLTRTRAIVYQNGPRKSRYDDGDVLVYVTLKIGYDVPCLLCGEFGDWFAHNEQYICNGCRFEVW